MGEALCLLLELAQLDLGGRLDGRDELGSVDLFSHSPTSVSGFRE